MDPNPESSWWITTESQVLSQSEDDAVLALRLGLAVNALRAQHRFSDAVSESTGPAGGRDQVWAFIQAVAFTREGLNILSGTGKVQAQSKRVKELAGLGNAPIDLQKTIAALQGGSHPASPLLARVRNQLAFHWDPELLHPWVREMAAGGTEIVWTEGVGSTGGEMIHRAAADALVNAILPDDPTGGDVSEKRFADALPHITSAMDALAQYFERAVTGYLVSVGSKTSKP